MKFLSSQVTLPNSKKLTSPNFPTWHFAIIIISHPTPIIQKSPQLTLTFWSSLYLTHPTIVLHSSLYINQNNKFFFQTLVSNSGLWLVGWWWRRSRSGRHRTYGTWHDWTVRWSTKRMEVSRWTRFCLQFFCPKQNRNPFLFFSSNQSCKQANNAKPTYVTIFVIFNEFLCLQFQVPLTNVTDSPIYEKLTINWTLCKSVKWSTMRFWCRQPKLFVPCRMLCDFYPAMPIDMDSMLTWAMTRLWAHCLVVCILPMQWTEDSNGPSSSQLLFQHQKKEKKF